MEDEVLAEKLAGIFSSVLARGELGEELTSAAPSAGRALREISEQWDLQKRPWSKAVRAASCEQLSGWRLKQGFAESGNKWLFTERSGR